MSNHKLDVSFDSKKGLLHATLTVPSVIKKRGVEMYDVSNVVTLLNEQGYSLQNSDCVSKTRNVVRTDYENATSGTWTFNLSGKVTDTNKKPAAPKVAAPKVAQKPSQSTDAPPKTTAEVLRQAQKSKAKTTTTKKTTTKKTGK